MRDLTPDDFRRATRERLLDEPGWVPARFRGRCCNCGVRFEEGTPVHSDPTSVRWVADCCATIVPLQESDVSDG